MVKCSTKSKDFCPDHQHHIKSWVTRQWWHTPEAEAGVSQFEASLAYRASSRRAQGYTETVLKNKTPKNLVIVCDTSRDRNPKLTGYPV